MSFEKDRVFLIIISALALGMLSSATGGKEWIVTNGERIGLWNRCTRYDNYCHTRILPKTDFVLKFIKALMVLGCLVSIAAFLLCVFMICVGDSDGKFISVFLFSTAAFGIIALTLLSTNVDKFIRSRSNNMPFDYGWCFIVAWLGTGLAVFGALLALKIHSEYHSLNKPIMV